MKHNFLKNFSLTGYDGWPASKVGKINGFFIFFHFGTSLHCVWRRFWCTWGVKGGGSFAIVSLQIILSCIFDKMYIGSMLFASIMYKRKEITIQRICLFTCQMWIQIALEIIDLEGGAICLLFYIIP